MAIIAIVLVAGLCPGIAGAQHANIVVSDNAQHGASAVTAGNADLTSDSDNLRQFEAKSGIYGSCDWTLSSDGVLTVNAGELPYDSWEYYFDPPWPWAQYNLEITSVVIKPGVIANKSIAKMFYDCRNLVSADLSGLDLTATEYIDGNLFGACSKLATINLAGWDTTNVKTNQLALPYMCSKVTLGSKTVFGENAWLSEPSTTSPYTGKWVRDGSNEALTSKEFMTLASQENAAEGTWKWQTAPDDKNLDKADITIGAEDVAWASGGSWVILNENGTFDLGEKVMFGGKQLKRDQDYKVLYYPYKNGDPFTPTEPGVYWVAIDGTGNYLGRQYVSTHFYGPNDLVQATIISEKEIVKGSGENPVKSVQLKGKTLVEGKDYELRYFGKDMYGDLNKHLEAAPNELGTYRVRAIGMGDYTGAASAVYSIVEKKPADNGGGSSGSSASPDPSGSGSSASPDPSGSGSSASPDPNGSGNSGASELPDKTDLKAYVGEAKKAGFSDLDEGAWYLGEGGKFPGTDTLYLDYTIKRGLMSGYTGARAGQFGPDDPLTRGMGATIIYRMATGKTAETTDNDVQAPFSDVPKGAWYAAAVKWCAENKVVTGYAGTTLFGPEDPITREQLATIIGRYMDPDGLAGSDVSMFKDHERISGFAKAGIAYCCAKGIMTGIGDTGLFRPQGYATRCQMAKVIAMTDLLHV